MGIGGHILGDRKLRRLRERSDLNLDRAYIRGQECEGRVIQPDGTCEHFTIDPETGASERIDAPMHWVSCPEQGGR